MFNSPYVSDALAWEESIKKASNRKKRVNNQSGSGLSRRYRKKRRFVFPKNKLQTNNEPKVEQIASTVAIEDRAESDLKHQKQDKTPYVKNRKSIEIPNSIKEKTSKRQGSQNGKSKGTRTTTGSKKRKSKGIKAKAGSKKGKPRGQGKKTNRVRKLDFDTSPSIFERKR